MREDQFGFEYSWADLQPIRLLLIVVISFQVVGGVLGLWVAHFSEWFSNLWAGAAIATSPGFAVGFIAQRLSDPASISGNRVMVRRLGLIALVLSLSVLVMPLR
ncbi:MAG TPA: hypothetical protein VJQ52_23870 [Steroidobacteraceae bacterium]|nr:hypothetical protein [Steroidobacteraceae bacterium]